MRVPGERKSMMYHGDTIGTHGGFSSPDLEKAERRELPHQNDPNENCEIWQLKVILKTGILFVYWNQDTIFTKFHQLWILVTCSL